MSTEKLWMVENDVPAEILQSGCYPCAETDRGVEIDDELIAEWEYAKQRFVLACVSLTEAYQRAQRKGGTR